MFLGIYAVEFFCQLKFILFFPAYVVTDDFNTGIIDASFFDCVPNLFWDVFNHSLFAIIPDSFKIISPFFISPKKMFFKIKLT